MALEQATFRITGTRPLLMHNGRLADPVGEHKKALAEITGKRKKTEDDHAEIRRREWLGGLYQDANGRVCIPESLLLGMLIEGARKRSKGPKAKCVVCSQPTYVLDYDGPKDVLKLYETPGFVDYRGAGVNDVRVYRTRPRFNKWSVTFDYMYDTEVLDIETLHLILDAAATVVGIGDYRPRFGLFTYEQL